MSRTSKDTKSHQAGSVVMLGANLPPYMSQEGWADYVKISKEAVRLRLNRGIISGYQPVEGGTVFVNVVAEFAKMNTVKAWN